MQKLKWDQSETIDLVKKLADNWSNIKKVKDNSLKEGNGIEINGVIVPLFDPVSLSMGYPGMCLLYSSLLDYFPEEEKWAQYRHEYIKELVEIMRIQKIDDISLFNGLSGIALSIFASSSNRNNYVKLLSSVEEFLTEKLEEKLMSIDNVNAVMNDYDTISGLAGVASYLLHDTGFPRREVLLKNILKYFVSMSKEYNYKGVAITKWHLHSNELFFESEKSEFPDGLLNLGVSHGLTGPLIILAKSYKEGIKVDGQKDAINDLLKLVQSLYISEEETGYWKGVYSFKEIENCKITSGNTRDAWCYGTPGVAWSVLVGADAIENRKIYDFAIQAMKKRIGKHEEIDAPTFCHGLAGLAYINYCFYLETKEDEFLTEAKAIQLKVLSHYQKQFPFGFQNWESGLTTEKEKMDSIGLLEGSIGIVLVLLALNTDGAKSLLDVSFLLR